ncbi:MAG TPA: DUF3311 domain-containing protein [Candidatus Polarisedimenticolaceae bacterium]|nr:DUF3311 domain-containing protein [Candidatus Polarisedimenticolaceae bacterium]
MPTREPRRSPAVTLALVLAVLVVLALRHDYWQWTKVEPLLFGFLPVGLWWQGLVVLLSCALMALLVRFAWPARQEREALEAERQRVESD